MTRQIGKCMIALSSLGICASAYADLAYPITLMPDPERSTVVARLERSAKDTYGQPINMLRVYSGYPKGATLMQRLILWRGESIDMHYVAKEPIRKRIMTSSCFLSKRKMRILTGSYKTETYGRVESQSGSTMIHGFSCRAA